MNYRIQIITKNLNFNEDINNNKISTFYNFESLDAYDFNIIDLNNSDILEYDASTKKFSFEKDFITIYDSIENMKTDNKIIFLSPQNIEIKLLKSNWASSDEMGLIKDNANLIFELLGYHFKLFDVHLMFDRDETVIGDKFLVSDFSLRSGADNEIITKNKHDKITTIKNNNLLFTTLQFKDTKDIIDFLMEIRLISNQIQAPQWFDEISSYDDDIQINNINKELIKIEKAKIKIKESEEILEKNNHYKSILYSNSDELVEVVYEILEDILSCDLSDFVDDKKEDFLIKFENNGVLIGEIKGVTSNVRFEHVGQVEQHYRRYLDDNPEYVNETIKQVLIINYERKKKPSERHEIHEDQIKLAERNGCLIIDTYSLLKIHESYLSENIGTEQLKEYIFNNSGLCKVDELIDTQ